MLVVELDSAGDGLGKGETAGGGDNTAQLLPDTLGDVLGHQGVLGLDVGEGFRHDYKLKFNKKIVFNLTIYKHFSNIHERKK